MKPRRGTGKKSSQGAIYCTSRDNFRCRIHRTRRSRLNFAQIAVIVNMHPIARCLLEWECVLLCCAMFVCVYKCMKGFDTISYATDLANKFLLLAVVLKVPPEPENWRLSSKLFFHPSWNCCSSNSYSSSDNELYCCMLCAGNKKMPQITRARAVNPP